MMIYEDINTNETGFSFCSLGYFALLHPSLLCYFPEAAFHYDCTLSFHCIL